MRAVSRVERLAAAVRTGTAALAVAAALLLLFKVPLLASFRGALIVLAALELLAFGRRALSSNARTDAWVEIAVKLVVILLAYLSVGQ